MSEDLEKQNMDSISARAVFGDEYVNSIFKKIEQIESKEQEDKDGKDGGGIDEPYIYKKLPEVAQ